MRKIIIIGYIGLLSISHCLAQVSSVSHATGTMAINIPLYTLSEGSLGVPIGLHYEGGGVPVDAAASNVGVNWSLEAGAYISRVVRDKPDESITKLDNLLIKGYLHEGYPNTTEYAFLRDYEPDIFNLVLGGNVIRFTLRKNSQGVVVPTLLDENADISIITVKDDIINPTNNVCLANTYDFNLRLRNTASDNGLSSFVVTTADGIRYIFGKAVNERQYVLQQNALEKSEYLLSATSLISAIACPITWHISQIEYPKENGVYQTITFNYTRRLQQFTSIAYDKPFSYVWSVCDETPKIIISPEKNFLYKCDLASISSFWS